MAKTKETELYEEEHREESSNIVPYILNNSIVKSNRLIQAKYKGGVLEEKIVYAALYAAQNKTLMETDAGYEVLISSNELREMTNYKGGSFYEKLKPAAAALMQRVYGIEDPENDRFEYIHLISKCTYDKGEFRIVFGKEQKNLIMNLTTNFTQLPVLMMKLKNVYAFRLYELLKSECYYKKDVPKSKRNNVFVITHSIAELKLALGVVDASSKEVRGILESKRPDFDKAVAKAKDTMYSVNGNFIRDVVAKATDEINAKLDMHINYKTKRFGRQTHDVEFTIDLNGNKVDIAEEKTKEMSEAEIFEFNCNVRDLFDDKLGFSEIPLIAKTSGYDLDRLKEIKKAMQNSRTEIGNPAGFILQALKEGYKFDFPEETNAIDIDPDVLQMSMKVLGKEFSEEDALAIVLAAENDFMKIKKAKQILDNQKHVNNAVGFMIAAIKKDYKEIESYSKEHRDKQGIVREDFDIDEWVRQKTINSL